MHTLVQKQVPVQRKDVHSAASIHDLSSQSEALQRKADLVGGGAVVQRMPPYDGGAGFQTEDNSMTDDLLHPQYANLFTADSIRYCNAHQPRGGWNYCTHGGVYHWLTSNNHENRRHIRYKRDYAHSWTLNQNNLLTWLQAHAAEHMYVQHNNKIYIANRNNEKRPHPTLVGGDPVVDGAGTMSYNPMRHLITITRSSGHFRPTQIAPATITTVADLGRPLGINVQT